MLVESRNPLNIGAAARAMSNFGFTDLRLVRPYEVSWREAKSAVGASAVLEAARVFDSVADAVADCSLAVGTASMGFRDARTAVHSLEQGGALMLAHEGKTALLFGSEKHGLSNDALSLCHWLIRIPTREEHESMNLGQAVAVCLYELIRGSRGRVAGVSRSIASSETLARFEEQLSGVLDTCGYANHRAPSAQSKLRRLLRRMDLDERDAEIWLGMLRQIRWKLDQR